MAPPAIRHATFASVRDLMIKNGAFIDSWNARNAPSIWTKSADEILAEIDRSVSMSHRHVTSDIAA